MPNTFAYLALIIWPIVSIFMFRKMSTLKAVFWTIVGGHMFLPMSTAFDFPMVPPLDKGSITSLVALFGCFKIKKEKILLIPEKSYERLFFIVLFVLPFTWVFTNNQPTYDGAQWLQALTIKDSISSILSQYITLIPFLLGLSIVKKKEDLLELLRLFVIAGLLYSFFVIYEARMSPQLHNTFYGFFPHSWIQQIRMGGFRPAVFMGHGLWVAIFMATTFFAALTLWKIKDQSFRFHPRLAVIYLFVMLLLCKSMGAFILAFIFTSFCTLVPQRMYNASVYLIALVVFSYPVLSILELFPHESILNFASYFSPERADSLEFRFLHETRLLERAQDRYYFGWGGWGRNRLSDSITDGYWILIFGVYGLVGFTCTFGLIYLAIKRGLNASTLFESDKSQLLIKLFTLTVTLLMVDQIPNASMTNYIWFLVGALLGASNSIIDAARPEKTTITFQNN